MTATAPETVITCSMVAARERPSNPRLVIFREVRPERDAPTDVTDGDLSLITKLASKIVLDIRSVIDRVEPMHGKHWISRKTWRFENEAMAV